VQLLARHNAQLVVEFTGDYFDLAGIVVKMRLFAGDFEVSVRAKSQPMFSSFTMRSTASIVSSDAAYMRRVSSRPYIEMSSLTPSFSPVSTMHHCANSRPADGFRFEHDDFRPAFG